MKRKKLAVNEFTNESRGLKDIQERKQFLQKATMRLPEAISDSVKQLISGEFEEVARYISEELDPKQREVAELLADANDDLTCISELYQSGGHRVSMIKRYMNDYLEVKCISKDTPHGGLTFLWRDAESGEIVGSVLPLTLKKELTLQELLEELFEYRAKGFCSCIECFERGLTVQDLRKSKVMH